MGPLLTLKLHETVLDGLLLEEIPLTYYYEGKLRVLLAQHVTVYTGEDLIDRMDGTHRSDHEISTAKCQVKSAQS